MRVFKHRYRVESTRLRGWDYSSSGWYFITICARAHACFLGEVIEGGMRLSEIGRVAHDNWAQIPAHFTEVVLDEFVVMPNHIHGILAVDRADSAGKRRATGVPKVETRDLVSLGQPTGSANRFGPLQPGSLQTILQAFKSSVTRWCRKNEDNSFSWQAGSYDHIIRNEESLGKIREYIINNPLKWELDRYNPANWAAGRNS